MVVQAQMISGDVVKQSTKAQCKRSRKETAITGEFMHKRYCCAQKFTLLSCKPSPNSR
jgi:hypothetical protein